MAAMVAMTTAATTVSMVRAGSGTGSPNAVLVPDSVPAAPSRGHSTWVLTSGAAGRYPGRVDASHPAGSQARAGPSTGSRAQGWGSGWERRRPMVSNVAPAHRPAVPGDTAFGA